MTEFEEQYTQLEQLLESLKLQLEELKQEYEQLALSEGEREEISQRAQADADAHEVSIIPFTKLIQVNKERITTQAVKNILYHLLKLPYVN